MKIFLALTCIWLGLIDGSGAAQERVLSRTEFIWDGDVLAYEETDGRRIEWFYEPSSFRPMARRENGQLHYIVNDHLGTPKEAFTERGSLVWSVDHHTWGTVRKAWMSSALDPVPDEKGEFLGESFDGQPVHTLRTSGNTALKASVKPNPLFIPMRFQGQYEDAETGLFYNSARFYDPLSTKYLSRDPIGIRGGFALNSYVLNPNTWIDPLGLKTCCLKDIFDDPCKLLEYKNVAEFVQAMADLGYTPTAGKKGTTHEGKTWDQGGPANFNNIPDLGNVRYHPGGGTHGSGAYYIVMPIHSGDKYRIPIPNPDGSIPEIKGKYDPNELVDCSNRSK